MTSAQVTQSFRIHTAYQALGRCSIRKADPTSTLKTVLTAGKDDARFLHALFPGSLWLGQVGDLPSVRATAAKAVTKAEGKTTALSKAILSHLGKLDGVDKISSRSLRDAMKAAIGTLSPKVQIAGFEVSDRTWASAVFLACSPGSGWHKSGSSVVRTTAESYGF